MLHPDKSTPVFIIIPAYNEEKIIRDVLQGLIPFQQQVIVVDDGSATALQPLLEDLPVTVLRHSINLGQGAALQTGFDYALSRQAGYIVTFDADGQHLPADIDNLLKPLISGEADIALGSRFLSKDSNIPSGRKRLLRFARLVNYIFTGLLLSDAHNGMRAMTAVAAQKIRLRQSGMAHATEIIAEVRKKKLRYKEVPVNIQYSTYSKAKGQSAWGSFRIFFDILLNKIFK
jgi:polyprenyl-phospho-N-acetylgalactosaminyl synthase